MTQSSDEKGYHALVHASSLIASWLGGLAFLGPLITWLVFKENHPSVEEHAKKALNFHITMFIITLLSALVLGAVFITMFTSVGGSEVGPFVYTMTDGDETIEVIDGDYAGDVSIPDSREPVWPMVVVASTVGWMIGLLLLQFIAPIVMAVKAYNGRFTTYPFTYPFFKGH